MSIIKRYQGFFADRSNFSSVVSGMLLLAISLVINHLAVNYAALTASNSVEDFFLGHTRTYDVDGLFIYGAIAMVAYIAAIAFYHPQRLAFMAKSIGLFVIIRALFLSLTHIAPYSRQLSIDPENPLRWFTSGADLFFSGHTGLPFLIALIFWDKPVIRYSFLVLSAFFAVIVILGHLHYSIDVFAAFFITYAIADMAKYFFASDYRLS